VNVKYLLILLFLVLAHLWPLANLDENLAGGSADPMAHAAIGEWYCKNVVTLNFHSDIYMAPYGADLSGNYDSPFPFILTCPFVSAGSLFQFHLFTLMQLLLIVFSGFLLGRYLFKKASLAFVYTLFVWWSGFYVVKSHDHMTLFSQIWGFQFLVYSVLSLNIKSRKSVLISSVLLALSFAGTFQNIASLFLLGLVLVSYKFWQVRQDFNKSSLVNCALGLLLVLLLTSIFWGPMIYFTLFKSTVQGLDTQRALYSFDLASFIFPYSNNLFYEWIHFKPVLGDENLLPIDVLVSLFAVVSLFLKQTWKSAFKILLLLMGFTYLLLSFGPVLKYNGQDWLNLDFNIFFHAHFPFGFSRTPARLAATAYYCFLLLFFIHVSAVQNKKMKNGLVLFLALWIVVTGPVLNQMWQFPHFAYRDSLPMQALNYIAQKPADEIVVNIPASWAHDQSQNFFRLFHKKNITSAYLAYPVYNKELIMNYMNDPFLSQLGCATEVLQHQETPLFQDEMNMKYYLAAKNYRNFIFTKAYLDGPECAGLKSWAERFLAYKWVRVIEETPFHIVAIIE
jgi:hypothetical protein